MTVRAAAVAGSWYPGAAEVLTAAVDRHLAAAAESPTAPEPLVALIAPHAGLMYSGPVAACSYRCLPPTTELVVLVGPSHFVGFEGVAAFHGTGFATPLGVVSIDRDCTAALLEASPVVLDNSAVHAREHSLEMQLPFIRRILPDAKIVALLVGWQTAAVAEALADALARVLDGRRHVVLVASTDLSHYQDAATAGRLDGIVIERVAALDPEGLQLALDARPEHACGGGPAVAVMRAARLLGADRAVILKYADSGDVSGDKSAVVGYLAAAIGAGSSLRK
jgi:AmmeMemoRadiSam system protein B